MGDLLSNHKTFCRNSLLDTPGLSLCARNILVKNEVTTLEALLRFLVRNSLSDLHGPIEGLNEIATLVLRLFGRELLDDEVIEDNYRHDDKDLAEDVIDQINNGILPNILLENVVGIPVRFGNVMQKNGVRDMLGMAELINKKPLREIKGAGETFIAICNKILEDFLNGTYTNKFDRNSTTTGLERFILSSKGTREYEVLLRRVRGEKLKDIGREIAENDSEIVSRERIRQIEMIFLKSLEVPLLTLLKTRLISRGS